MGSDSYFLRMKTSVFHSKEVASSEPKPGVMAAPTAHQLLL